MRWTRRSHPRHLVWVKTHALKVRNCLSGATSCVLAVVATAPTKSHPLNETKSCDYWRVCAHEDICFLRNSLAHELRAFRGRTERAIRESKSGVCVR